MHVSALLSPTRLRSLRGTAARDSTILEQFPSVLPAAGESIHRPARERICVLLRKSAQSASGFYQVSRLSGLVPSLQSLDLDFPTLLILPPPELHGGGVFHDPPRPRIRPNRPARLLRDVAEVAEQDA